MAIITGSWLLDALSILFGILGVLYLYLINNYKYWEKRGVKQLKPTFLLGNVSDNFLQKKQTSELFQDFYNEAKGERYIGFYELWRPSLLVRDIDLIKHVLVKDFNHFQDHNFTVHEDVDPLNAKNLIIMTGEKWKNMRTKLTPMFTSGKMKKMFPLMMECAEELKNYLVPLAKKQEVVDVKETMARFATDVISSCAFGVRCNCLQDPNAEFRKVGKELTDNPSFYKAFEQFIILFFPGFNKYFRARFVSEENTQFFRNLVRNSMEHREKNKVSRNDLIDLLIQLKNKGYVEDDDLGPMKHVLNHGPKQEFSHDDLTAQALLFFIGGFETSANTMTFALYELSLNPEVRTKLQEEIDSNLQKHGGMTYEGIHEMVYLDKVIKETLRKYPPLGILSRKCTKEYKVPNSDLVIEKGINVHVPIYGIQRDPQYFLNPEKFNPDRFSEEHKWSKADYTHMPFGQGPRQCIGNRFGLLQTKIGLTTVLSQYDVKTCSKTEIPLVIDPGNFIVQSKSGIWLQLSQRRK